MNALGLSFTHGDSRAAAPAVGGVARAVADLRLGGSLGLADDSGTLWVTALDDLNPEASGDAAAADSGAILCTAQRAMWLAAGGAVDGDSLPIEAQAMLSTAGGPWTPTERIAHTVAIGLLKRAALLPMARITDHPLGPWNGEVHAAGALAGALRQPPTLKLVAEAPVPLVADEGAVIRAFRPDDGGREHLLIAIGNPETLAAPLLRIHSECFTGDLLGSLRCDCGGQLRGSMGRLGEGGGGFLAYLAQEGRGIGLVNKLRAYGLQDQGLDTVDANLCLGYLADERDFAPAAAMLKHVGVNTVRLLSNNPAKVESLMRAGIAVAERISLQMPGNRHNQRYLDAKALRFGHDLG